MSVPFDQKLGKCSRRRQSSPGSFVRIKWTSSRIARKNMFIRQDNGSRCVLTPHSTTLVFVG